MGGVPGAEAGAGGAGECAGWLVHVGKCHEVGGEGGGVGLGEAGEGEGAWGEEAGGRVGGWGRLVRVEGAAVVFWGAEAVAGGRRGLVVEDKIGDDKLGLPARRELL